ncbi:MAG: thioredoxin domain-containing protein [Odoribacter sp.]
MKKTLILFLLLTMWTMQFANAQNIINLTTKEFKEKIWDFDKNKDWKFTGDKPVIIDLYATWCPPCKKLSPILEEIQKQYGNKIQIYKIDVDKDPQLAQLFNASSIPLMIFIPKNGKPFTVAGLRPQEQIEQIITEKLDVKK